MSNDLEKFANPEDGVAVIDVVKEALNEPVELENMTQDQFKKTVESGTDWKKACQDIAFTDDKKPKKVEKSFILNCRRVQERNSRLLTIIPLSETDLRRSIIAENKQITEMLDMIEKTRKASRDKVLDIIIKAVVTTVTAFGLQIFAAFFGDKLSGKAADKHVPTMK